MVISFFVSAYVVRYLGPENYGSLSYASSYTNLFLFISVFGIDLILYRNLASNPERQNELLGTSFVLRLIGGAAAIAIALFSTVFFHNSRVINILIALISVSFIFQSFSIVACYFQAKVKSKYITISSLAGAIILSFAKLLVIRFDKGILYFGAIVLLEPVIYALFYLYFFKKEKQNISSWRFDKQTARSLLKDSWPLAFTSAFTFIYSKIDQIIIKQMIDVASVGLYDAAVRLAEIWYFLPAIILSSILPAIINSKKVSEELYRARWKKIYFFMIWSSLAIALPITFFAKHIILLLYGHNYLASIAVLQIYVWSGVFIFLITAVNQYLIIENLSKLLLYGSLLSMTANIILNLLLIPRLGIIGASLATLLSYGLTFLPIFISRKTRWQFKFILKSILLR